MGDAPVLVCSMCVIDYTLYKNCMYVVSMMSALQGPHMCNQYIWDAKAKLSRRDRGVARDAMYGLASPERMNGEMAPDIDIAEIDLRQLSQNGHYKRDRRLTCVSIFLRLCTQRQAHQPKLQRDVGQSRLLGRLRVGVSTGLV